MVQVKDLTQLTVKDLWQEVKDEEEWWGDLKQETLRVVQRLLEGAMEGEVAATAVPRCGAATAMGTATEIS